MNGGGEKAKVDYEFYIEEGAYSKFDEIQREMCKILGIHYSCKCKIYDKEGVVQNEDDMGMMNDNDILYIANDGRFCISFISRTGVRSFGFFG